jgi:tRNA nucleotidyltransferase/poly(A) polymerase
MQINPKLIPRQPGVYIVGGTIRDLLLKRDPSDYDIAAVRPCEELAETIAEKAGSRAILLGKPGKSIYRIHAGNEIYDVSPLVGDKIESDLLRRDFTINAMAWDVSSQALIDPAGGLSDLKEGRVRMIRAANLLDDPLRMLRAYRLGAALCFHVDKETEIFIRNHAENIKQCAVERTGDELMKLLAARRSHPYLVRMKAASLLAAVLPELGCLNKPGCGGTVTPEAFSRTLSPLFHLEDCLQNAGFFSETEKREPLSAAHRKSGGPAPLKLSLLLNGSVAGHTEDDETSPGADHTVMIRTVCRRLRLSGKLTDYLILMGENRTEILRLFAMHEQEGLTRRDIVRFCMKTGSLVPDLILQAIASARAVREDKETPFESFCRQLFIFYRLDFLPRAASPPLITGRDLIREIGLSASPVFSEILSRIEEERLTGSLRSREAALTWLKKSPFLDMDS